MTDVMTELEKGLRQVVLEFSIANEKVTYGRTGRSTCAKQYARSSSKTKVCTYGGHIIIIIILYVIIIEHMFTFYRVLPMQAQ